LRDGVGEGGEVELVEAVERGEARRSWGSFPIRFVGGKRGDGDF